MSSWINMIQPLYENIYILRLITILIFTCVISCNCMDMRHQKTRSQLKLSAQSTVKPHKFRTKINIIPETRFDRKSDTITNKRSVDQTSHIQDDNNTLAIGEGNIIRNKVSQKKTYYRLQTQDGNKHSRFAAGVPDIVEGNDTLTEIWILGLFPLNGSWAGGLGQLPAIEMAIEDINADPTMLPGYTLRMTVNDTQCHAGIGTNAMYEQLYSDPPKLMILGAGCSIVSQATAQASYLWNLVQLSYSSASPALSKKDVYPRFFRVFPPESSFNPAKFALLRYFGWRKVGLLHQVHELFSLTNEEFEKKAHTHGINILTSESFVDEPSQQVMNLKKAGARIIIGSFYEDKARQVFCEAFKNGMYGPQYVWIITGFYSEQWWRKTDSAVDCDVKEIEQALKGYMTADALPSSLSAAPGLAGKGNPSRPAARTYNEFKMAYEARTNNSKQTGHQESPYGYDSAWAVAKVLNTSLHIMREEGWDRSLEHFNYLDKDMANLFLRVINDTTFEGVSGPVMFDDNGDRKGNTQIEQLQFPEDGPPREVLVGVYVPYSNSSDADIQWKKTDEGKLTVWWEGDKAPTDSVAELVVPRLISLGLFVTVTTLASCGLVLTCLFLAFNIKFRHKRYIKMSSPNMNNVILLGALMAFLAMIFGGAQSVINNSQLMLVCCKVYNWTLALGFSLAFGAMFSKTWRVHKIFTNKKIQRMVIKDYQLLGLVCVLVGIDVLILTAWELLDPLTIRYYNKTLELKLNPENDHQVLVPQTRFCESTHMWYFAGILCAIKGLLLVFGAFLAFETRKVTVPALNDSKFIGMSVYNISLLCVIGLPVSLLMKDNVNASYVLISLFIFFATALTICLVFIPKVKHRNHEPHPGKMFNQHGARNGRMTQKDNIYIYTDSEIVNIQDENKTLKETLENCRRRLRQVENCNGLHPCVHTPSDARSQVTPDSANTPLATSRLLSQTRDLDDPEYDDEMDLALNGGNCEIENDSIGHIDYDDRL